MGNCNKELKVPEGWRVVKLGEVIEILDSQRIPLDSEYRLTIKGEIPYCGATGIIDYINDYIFEGEYVLIAEDGGRFNRFEETAYIMNGKFWANNHVHVVEGKIGILKNTFLKYFIDYEDIGYYISGSTREKLNQKLLRSIQIYLPPLPEQQRIAEILETVDNAIEKTDQIIEKYKRIKKGLMQDLLTKGVVSDELGVMSDELGIIGHGWRLRDEKRDKFKDSPLGKIPEEWEVVRLGETGTIIYGEGLKQEFYTDDGNSEVYGTGGIIGKTNFFHEIGPAIILPRKGTIIGIYYIKDSQKFWVIDTAFYLKPKKIDAKFCYYILTQVRWEVLNEATGVPSLNRENIKLITLQYPPLPEQQRIASILSQIDEAIEKETAYKEKLQRLKLGLMEDLLTGKVRVNHLIEEKN